MKTEGTGEAGVTRRAAEVQPGQGDPGRSPSHPGRMSETRLVHIGRSPHDHHGAVNTPTYRASTILQPTLEAWEDSRRADFAGYRYGRKETPTTRAFESSMAELYGAERCVAVSSGVASIAVAVIALTRAGDHVLVSDSVFEPTRALFGGLLERFGVQAEYYDPGCGANIVERIRPNTSLIFVESPGSLTFEVQDVPAIARVAHAHGIKVVADNTWATALHCNPLQLGVDCVVEATTKYVGGHADLLMGVALGSGEVGERLHRTAKTLGMCCGADDLYLALRGLRSVALRMRRSAETGLELAAWLAGRSEVTRVLHPALPSHPTHALWRRDFTGCCGLFGVVLRPMSRRALSAFYDGLELFGIGASWGGYESLVMPTAMSAIRTQAPWNEAGPLIRTYVGLEDPLDLIADLRAAFERASRVANTE